MTEPEKDQIGDGQDNLGQAAGKAAQAAKQNPLLPPYSRETAFSRALS